jgi:hypothetical protein
VVLVAEVSTGFSPDLTGWSGEMVKKWVNCSVAAVVNIWSLGLGDPGLGPFHREI